MFDDIDETLRRLLIAAFVLTAITFALGLVVGRFLVPLC